MIANAPITDAGPVRERSGSRDRGRVETPTPLIGYLRVSTDLQEISIDAQRAVIAAHCAARSWPEPQWAVDQGWSGGNLERPAIAAALDRLDAAGTGTLVVAKLDRLSRSVADFAGLMERAKLHGWQVWALDIGVDMSTAGGELIASIFAALAQWERRTIADRTRVALAELRARGQRLGRPSAIPVEVLERIVTERAADRTIQEIADSLNADGIPTARGAARWSKSTIYGALKTATLDDQAAASRHSGE